MISRNIERIDSLVEKLDMLHDLLGREIDEVRSEVSALRAELGLTGQPELGLDAEAPPAAGVPAEDYLCTCGHARGQHRDGTGICLAAIDPREACPCTRFFPNKEIATRASKKQ